jgi:hypothetical protein
VGVGVQDFMVELPRNVLGRVQWLAGKVVSQDTVGTVAPLTALGNQVTMLQEAPSVLFEHELD